MKYLWLNISITPTKFKCTHLRMVKAQTKAQSTIEKNYLRMALIRRTFKRDTFLLCRTNKTIQTNRTFIILSHLQDDWNK